ncbi:MAG: hypothetical protein DKINENOH_02924 [bacterium]|nr:hypothetical protein [bacterium]
MRVRFPDMSNFIPTAGALASRLRQPRGKKRKAGLRCAARRSVRALGYAVLMAFLYSICHPLSNHLLHGLVASDPGGLSGAPAAASHQCPCAAAGGLCKCQGSCCSGTGVTVICQSTNLPAAPESPRVILVVSPKDYLLLSQKFRLESPLFGWLALTSPRPPAGYCLPPEVPPPRFSPV